jgi:hypothetical protein
VCPAAQTVYIHTTDWIFHNCLALHRDRIPLFMNMVR